MVVGSDVSRMHQRSLTVPYMCFVVVWLVYMLDNSQCKGKVPDSLRQFGVSVSRFVTPSQLMRTLHRCDLLRAATLWLLTLICVSNRVPWPATSSIQIIVETSARPDRFSQYREQG